jgi:hypothetical protein
MVLAKRLVKIYMWRISSQKLGVGCRVRSTLLCRLILSPQNYLLKAERLSCTSVIFSISSDLTIARICWAVVLRWLRLGPSVRRLLPLLY